MNLREELFAHLVETYHAQPEYLWRRYPEYAIFRHADNKKWFGLVMNVRRSYLGLEGDEWVDILNVKMPEPLLADLLVQQEGYFRGYHISRGNWVSILLDGTVPFADVTRWLEESYRATASQKKKQSLRAPKEWLIPANPKYYDVEGAFEAAQEIDWKQGAGIKKGDTVYLYVAAPVSAIRFRCLVTETDHPYHYEDGALRIRSVMRIRLEKTYPADQFPFERLKDEYGIFAVRGPRGIPAALRQALR